MIRYRGPNRVCDKISFCLVHLQGGYGLGGGKTFDLNARDFMLEAFN
jgi:hypothetical protein